MESFDWFKDLVFRLLLLCVVFVVVTQAFGPFLLLRSPLRQPRPMARTLLWLQIVRQIAHLFTWLFPDPVIPNIFPVKQTIFQGAITLSFDVFAVELLLILEQFLAPLTHPLLVVLRKFLFTELVKTVKHMVHLEREGKVARNYYSLPHSLFHIILARIMFDKYFLHLLPIIVMRQVPQQSSREVAPIIRIRVQVLVLVVIDATSQRN